MPVGELTRLRTEFHDKLRDSILTLSSGGAPSNADGSSPQSREIAAGILEELGGARVAPKMAGQTAGSVFEEITTDFVSSAFELLRHIRPGRFETRKGASIAEFQQYAHLDDLEAIAKASREIATALGSDYLIKPDVVVIRWPLRDREINGGAEVLDGETGLLSGLRGWNDSRPVLHASISCKWTLRSDRAQNARSEALNLVRNRKGPLPRISVTTAEPLPSRIASLALGTGDIDCVYHFALRELRDVVSAPGMEGYADTLEMMIEGQRLRDIADLPLDLAI